MMLHQGPSAGILALFFSCLVLPAKLPAPDNRVTLGFTTCIATRRQSAEGFSQLDE
jgi:hypothetical protein